VLNAMALAGSANAGIIIGRLILWPLLTLIVTIAARLLGGKASYTVTFRVMSFAFAEYWLLLLSGLPVIGPFVRVSATILAFLGVWLGTAQAHQLRGWRALVLPVVYLIVLVMAGVLLRAVLAGGVITIELLFGELGL